MMADKGWAKSVRYFHRPAVAMIGCEYSKLGMTCAACE